MIVNFHFDMLGSNDSAHFNLYPENEFEESACIMTSTISVILDEIATAMISKAPEELQCFIKETLILSLITGFYKDADINMPEYNTSAYKALFDAIELWSKEFMGGVTYERA